MTIKGEPGVSHALMVSAFRAASRHLRSIVRSVKGDRVEALVDTGQGVQR